MPEMATTNTLADKIVSFLSALTVPTPVPDGVAVLNPFQDETALHICRQFYKKYYSDNRERFMIMGINPGRFGGGITGIPFTDPIKLETKCDIPNNLQKKAELSADFMYRMIEAFGGPDKFYSHFYITAVSPLGFTKDGKNLNYYDIKELQKSLNEFIIVSLRSQLAFGINRSVCYCLGEGQNFKFLSQLNRSHAFFDRIVPLSHPRFIMQYRRKRIQEFVDDYLDKFTLIG
jgi:hypothetical protein